MMHFNSKKFPSIRNRIIFVFFVIAFFILIKPSSAQAATLYFNNVVGDSHWDTIGNWWIVENITPAPSLPTESDDVIINGDVYLLNLGADPIVVNTMTVNAGFYFADLTATVINGATFNNTSTNNNATILGDAFFHDTSSNYNAGVISGTATFYDDSYNDSLVTGNAFFYNSSYNYDTINGDATFYDSSFNTNYGTVTGNADFNNAGYNNGTVNGDATFNDDSINSGTVSGNAIFSDASSNYDIVTGNSTFNDASFNSINGGAVTGTATFTYAHAGVITIPDGGQWGGGSAASNLDAEGGLITSWIFNGNSSASGTINGDATFNGSNDIMNITINGDATFNSSSSIGGGSHITGNATFNGSSSISSGIFMTGNAIFNGSSINYNGNGTITGNATFNGSSMNNYGTITGIITFNGSSINNNTIATGDITFNGTSVNNGTVNGDTIFNDASSNVGAVTGTATFTYAHAGVITIPDGGQWGGGSAASNLDAEGGLITSWIFNGTSVNNGTVNGDTIFNDASSNVGAVTGTATFTYAHAGVITIPDGGQWGGGSAASNLDAEGGLITSWIFNGTSFNYGTVTGNATFNGDLSENYGTVTGTKTRVYTENISIIRDFISDGPWTVVADGAVVTISGAQYDDATIFLTPNGGSFVQFSKYWFNAGANAEWTTLSGNWWDDANHSQQSSALPDVSDYIQTLGTTGPNIDLDTWIQPAGINATATGITFTSQDGNGLGINISGAATFNGASINYGAISGDAIFNNSSQNSANVTGNGIFQGSSVNNGYVAGNATFNESSINGGTVNSNGIFQGSSVNNGYVAGNATFNESSVNNYYIYGNATFSDSSSNNGGIVQGSATFNGSSIDPLIFSTNYGTISGSATFNNSSQNVAGGTIEGNADFNDTSSNSIGGTVSRIATFNDASTNSGTATIDATFNNTSSNSAEGLVSRNGIFNNTSANYGTINFKACFALTATNAGTVVIGPITIAAVCPTSLASSFVSVTNGNWNDGATWGYASPGVENIDFPGSIDDATVANNVTLTENQSIHDISISPEGILNLGINIFNVSDNFTNNGTFNADTSTVVLSGTNQTILGANTFYNLTKTTNVADTLSFDATNITTITGTLTLTGTSNGLLTVRNAPNSAALAFDSKFGASRALADGNFRESTGATIDSLGNTYVVDNGNNRIEKYDPAGNFLLTFGWGVQDGSNEFQICTSGCQGGKQGFGDGEFSSPSDITTDLLHNIYIADSGNQRIQKFSPAGNFLLTFGWGVQDGSNEFQTCSSDCETGLYGDSAGQFTGPSSITTDDFNNIYVTDGGNKRIQKFDFDGNFLFAFGWGVRDETAEWQICTSLSGCRAGISGETAPFSPQGITVDPEGNIYVADATNKRIEKFDSEGNFLLTFGWGVQDGSYQFQICISNCLAGIPQIDYLDPPGDGQFSNPYDISADTAGNTYVADSGNNRIEKFGPAGNFLLTFGWGVQDGSNEFQTCGSACLKGSYGSGDGQFAGPSAITTDLSNNIYVTDGGNNRIEKFGPTGNFLLKFGNNNGGGIFNGPWGITSDTLDNIYVLDLNNNRIQKFDPSGNFLLMFGWGVQDGSNEFQICTSGCREGIEGNGAGQLTRPTAIATDDFNHIYVADTGNNRISKFSSSGNFLFTFGWGVQDGSNEFQICTSNCQAGIPPVNPPDSQYPPGDGQLGNPQGITTDSFGNLYVVDSVDNFHNRILKFNPDGNFLLTFGWGVQDGSNEFQICSSGCQGGTEGHGDGQFFLPVDITTDSFNNIYVTDGHNNRVEKFDAGGNFLLTFGKGVQSGNQAQICTSGCRAGLYGTAEGEFNTSQYITADSSNNIYVSDGNYRIQKFDSAGNFLLVFGWGVKDGSNQFQICTSNCQSGIGSSIGPGDGQIDSIRGIATNSSNNVFVIEASKSRVEKFGPPISAWEINPQSPSLLTYLSVSSSHSTSPVTCTNCLDGGGNLNWNFVTQTPTPPTPPSTPPGGGSIIPPFIGNILPHLPNLPTIHIPTRPTPTAPNSNLPNTAINVVPSVCKQGDTFNPVTGQTCASYTSINTVCPPGDRFSHTTGLPCTSIQITPPKPHCSITSTLRQGSKGDEVRCLQTTLKGLVIDGIFGVKTKASVTSFQRDNKLSPDGVFGPKTRKIWVEN